MQYGKSQWTLKTLSEDLINCDLSWNFSQGQPCEFGIHAQLMKYKDPIWEMGCQLEIGDLRLGLGFGIWTKACQVKYYRDYRK